MTVKRRANRPARPSTKAVPPAKGPGKPRLGEHVRKTTSISLDEDDMVYAREIGKGNVSAGVTLALRAHRDSDNQGGKQT